MICSRVTLAQCSVPVVLRPLVVGSQRTLQVPVPIQTPLSPSMSENVRGSLYSQYTF